MIEAQVDFSPMAKRLDAMLKQLEEFPQKMSNEFLTWQRDDMRRQVPEATPEDNGVSTIITPRGQNQGPRRRHRIVAKGIAISRIKSNRPILRPELFDRLVDRMDTLLDNELEW